MSADGERLIAFVGVCVLVAAIGVGWQLADVRAAQATHRNVSEYVDSPVPTGTSPTGDDRDGDGIPDSVDACPTDPETVNGLRDRDGCPDVVATTRAS